MVLWDLTDPAQPRRLGTPLTNHSTELLSSMAFSPHGPTLATSSGDSDDGTILWNLGDPAQPRRMEPPLAEKGSVVAFSPNGLTLAAGRGDGGIILWDLTALNNLRDHATERGCAITGGGLDRDEWARYISGLAYHNTCST